MNENCHPLNLLFIFAATGSRFVRVMGTTRGHISLPSPGWDK